MRLQLKPDRVREVSQVLVEPGAVCNLRCSFCPTGNGTVGLSQHFLGPRVFDLILRRLGPSVTSVSLLHLGEPFLNPNLYELIELAGRRGIRVSLHSHFSKIPFDREKAKRLIDSGLAELLVSCDGASQKTYRKYRVGGDFDRVLENLDILLRAKAERESQYPEIIWKFLVHKANEHEIVKARAIAKRLKIRVIFQPLCVPADQSRDWVPRRHVATERRTSFCAMTWDTPVIHSDGAVLPCCVIDHRRYSLGNILREPFDKIWNKPLIVEMRKYLRTGKKASGTLPCHGCPYTPHRA
ncbi:MAG: radical SAM protein [Elusimicrobia bacterium]|nr:radical SAM protein [Elusimicrobiota bacterium]